MTQLRTFHLLRLIYENPAFRYLRIFLASVRKLNGAWGTWQNASLPNWDMKKYHNLRIRKNGDNSEIISMGCSR